MQFPRFETLKAVQNRNATFSGRREYFFFKYKFIKIIVVWCITNHSFEMYKSIVFYMKKRVKNSIWSDDFVTSEKWTHVREKKIPSERQKNSG